MINVRDFRDCVVAPALSHLKLYSLAAEQLVLATAVHESHLTYLRQIGGGPARGLFQMEPATHRDIWTRYLAYRPALAARTLMMRALWASTESQLVNNSAYACALCRIHYRRVRAPLPPAGDAAAIAAYWKQHYNTPRGAGSAALFIGSYQQFVAPLYN